MYNMREIGRRDGSRSTMCGKDSHVLYIDFHLLPVMINSHINQLRVGTIAQLVEHCTGIAEVWVQIPHRPEFSRSSRAVA